MPARERADGPGQAPGARGCRSGRGRRRAPGGARPEASPSSQLDRADARRAPAARAPPRRARPCATSTSTRRAATPGRRELAELAHRRDRGADQVAAADEHEGQDERRRRRARPGSSGPRSAPANWRPERVMAARRSSPLPIWPRRKAVRRALPRTWSSRTSLSGTLRVGLIGLALGPDRAEAAQVPRPGADARRRPGGAGRRPAA